MNLKIHILTCLLHTSRVLGLRRLSLLFGLSLLTFAACSRQDISSGQTLERKSRSDLKMKKTGKQPADEKTVTEIPESLEKVEIDTAYFNQPTHRCYVPVINWEDDSVK